ncbi:MAG: hypothetical protein AB7E81_03795 [Hyphomicrobiaceae bacterium]
MFDALLWWTGLIVWSVAGISGIAAAITFLATLAYAYLGYKDVADYKAVLLAADLVEVTDPNDKMEARLCQLAEHYRKRACRAEQSLGVLRAGVDARVGARLDQESMSFQSASLRRAIKSADRVLPSRAAHDGKS